jgi:hypothetical protein
MDAPAFPTRTGTRRDCSNVLKRIVQPALDRASQLREGHPLHGGAANGRAVMLLVHPSNA